ncbi:M20 metallopeptidase family protein [Mangrovivirga cuniculi]|uniref:Amidohydrolase n=1 Tax=Mangrovivirga cuniculi TaxID=2715131 RepID=A0A4D7JQ70_9BACT|nr:amidohydrolase [Mangrovivirga cuniculi]QCK13626.1 amidohydrolase [Mangrovivirga cuniculi]
MKVKIDDLVKFRRTLHKHPELSDNEKQTQKWILKRLEKIENGKVSSIGKTGVIVTFEGDEPGPEIMLRGDIDALPIQEESDLEYKSVNDGVAHLCGHDGHTTIILGTTRLLDQTGIKKGKVHLLFQPAEENGHGARAVIDDPLFEEVNPDVVYSLHNIPGVERGKILCKQGSFSCAADSIIIKLKGVTAHAAEPEHGINPMGFISKMISQFAELQNPDLSNNDFQLMTPIYAHVGNTSYGVSAGYGELHYTLRTKLNARMAGLKKSVKDIVREVCDGKINYEIDWTESFFANVNDEHAVNAIKNAADKCGLKYEEIDLPFKWGEDFGLFTDKFSGAMFGIGAGEDVSALHNPDYDFPDEIIRPSIEMFMDLVDQKNHLNESFVLH